MPVYRYVCRLCGHAWGTLIYPGLKVPTPRCPRCGQTDVEQREVEPIPGDHGPACPCCS